MAPDLVASAGIIPARAGSSPRRRRFPDRSRDHPRTRGEQLLGVPVTMPTWGSSPHARGARGHRWRSHRHPGTIPARAGSTSRGRWRRSRRRDHPRTRGEHVQGDTELELVKGPSPHARGAPVDAGLHGLVGGTIPARAGSTVRSGCRWPRRRDHPRTRGEHLTPNSLGNTSAGPSPHARGAQPGGDSLAARKGTIPARAGSTRSPGSPTWPARDHPRTRGEHESGWVTWFLKAGPSPHARGALDVLQPERPGDGTIPARAGSTRGSTPTGTSCWDHPRTRGEHQNERRNVQRDTGPSPHARGAQ